jgi:hypothetical protein
LFTPGAAIYVLVAGVYIYLHDGETVTQTGFTDQSGHYAFALGWGKLTTSSFYSFEKWQYQSQGFLLPHDATRISNYEFGLDVVLNRSIIVQ